MSDPNYNATPPGGYSWDDEDYRRHNREVEPDERRLPCEGCGQVLPLMNLEQTRDGWLCETCLYGYRHVVGMSK